MRCIDFKTGRGDRLAERELGSLHHEISLDKRLQESMKVARESGIVINGLCLDASHDQTVFYEPESGMLLFNPFKDENLRFNPVLAAAASLYHIRINILKTNGFVINSQFSAEQNATIALAAHSDAMAHAVLYAMDKAVYGNSARALYELAERLDWPELYQDYKQYEVAGSIKFDSNMQAKILRRVFDKIFDGGMERLFFLEREMIRRRHSVAAQTDVTEVLRPRFDANYFRPLGVYLRGVDFGSTYGANFEPKNIALTMPR